MGVAGGFFEVKSEGVEVWRGGVNAWQCDQMGHLNVRFYIAHAMEGLAALAAEIGMPGAYSPRGSSTLLVREHHVRFLREARVGEPLHMVAGVAETTDDGALVRQLLLHSAEGAPAAVFHSLVTHATSAEARPFPWPAPARARAESVKLDLLETLQPKTFKPRDPAGAGQLSDAERLGLMHYGAGAFGPEHCDVFGRVAAHQLMARMGDGAAQGITITRRAVGEEIGLAVVEYRIVHLDWPRAGDRFVTRSGLRRAEPRRLSWTHWMLDPDTGRPWAAAHTLLVPFDLHARKTVSLPDAAVAELKGRVVERWPK